MSARAAKISAGLLMFRVVRGELETLLVHPGGPYFRRQDAGAWTIPKGEVLPNEELLTRAKIEFEEELGFAPSMTTPIALGSIKQKGGKVVHAWAFEGNLPENFELKSNVFAIEWPPRSGRMTEFLEIDRAEFFADKVTREKINPAQIPFLDRLRASLTNE